MMSDIDNEKKMSIPNLHLDNFLLPSAVPEDCPFVLTSPRSLQACEKVGVQPVDLLPSSLSDYCAAFPDLPREGVISIFREEETGREEMLARCREVRREIIREDKEEGEGMIETVKNMDRTRKTSCLSPIVELKVSRVDSPEEER
jgi:hypothetical protein